MDREARVMDLNTERAYRYVEMAKVYGKKVSFNLRTLIMDVPREGRLKRISRKFRRAGRETRSVDMEKASKRAASEMVYQHYRFSALDSIYSEALDKYSDYYDSLQRDLKKLRSVKSYRGWKLKTKKRKARLYERAKELYKSYDKDCMDDINRMLRARVKAINAKKENVWNNYLNEPESFTPQIEEYLFHNK